MFALDVASRFLHVLTAIILLGGSTFMLLVILPSLQASEDSLRKSMASTIRDRWKRFVHLGIAIFLLTGFYNYFQAMPKHKGDGLYHALVGTKILLALAVFFVASALVGRSSTFDSMRQNQRKWLTLLCLLGIVIVAISSFVNVRGIPG